MKTIAIIGTGIMGRGMAENLHRAGHRLRLYARNAAKIQDMLRERIEIFPTPAEAARGSDLAVLCLTEDEIVERAFFDSSTGILGARPLNIIDTGTTSPELTVQMHGAAEAAGIPFLDAPMTGSKNAAAAGQILFMVGGTEEDIARLSYFFEACGKKTVPCGIVSGGQRTKIALNLVQAGLLQMYVEGFTLAAKDGIPSSTLMDVLTNSAAASPLLDFKLDCIRRRDFAPHFSLKNMNKDVNHGINRAQVLHAVLPLSSALKTVYEAGMAAGQGEEDFCSLARVMENLNRTIIE